MHELEKEKSIILMKICVCCLSIYRQLKGEELQGLTIEELHKLEKSLETGLSRVLERKVCSSILCLCVCVCVFMRIISFETIEKIHVFSGCSDHGTN